MFQLTDVGSLTPCSPIQQLHSTGHATFTSARLHNEGRKIMNVQMYLAGFLSKAVASQAACLLCPICPSDSPRPIGTFPRFSPSHSFKLFTLPPLSVRLSVCLSVSRCLDAEVHFVNMTALNRGGLHSSFWIVDRKHIYIGSADMDWRSLSKVTTNIDNMSVCRIKSDRWVNEPLQSGAVGSAVLFWPQNGYSRFFFFSPEIKAGQIKLGDNICTPQRLKI